MRRGVAGSYRAITGRVFDLGRLDHNERKFIAAVYEKYRKSPEWSDFAAWWIKEFDRRRLDDHGQAYRICQDLEARLGVAQGKVAPPDYRDYLADLIEAKYGSRYKFCQATGVDQGQLSRVFASRADLSLKALQDILRNLEARLVIQPEADLKANASVEAATRKLAGLR